VETIEKYRQIIKMVTKKKDVTVAFMFKETLEDEEQPHDLYTRCSKQVEVTVGATGTRRDRFLLNAHRDTVKLVFLCFRTSKKVRI
jgi:hypothetical protein